MMRNENPSFFVQRYLLVDLESWYDLFLEMFFLTRKKIQKTCMCFGPTRLKTPKKKKTGQCKRQTADQG